MSIPGMNMEGDPQDPVDPALAADPADPVDPVEPDDDDDDTLVPTVQVGQQQMVPVSELIRNRKEARAAKKELAALKDRAERADAIDARLQEAQPYIEQLRTLTPAQLEAFKSGKLASPANVPQNEADDEAREVAEDYGLITAAGELDIARARKIIDKNNARVAREVQQAVGPVRQHTAQQQAQAMLSRTKAIKDEQGVPYATAESLDEAYKILPAELAADPNVAVVAIGTAMFIDRMKKRRPQGAEPTGAGYVQPIHSEAVGGGRRAPSMTAEERLSASKLGLTEKDMTSAHTALSQSGGRRGIALE